MVRLQKMGAACSEFECIMQGVTNKRELGSTNQTEIRYYHTNIKQNWWLLNLNPTSDYAPATDGLIRSLDVVTKGRGPLIPLIRSTGGVLAKNEDRITGWTLVNPGAGETGDIILDGTEGTADVRDEVDWRLREPLRLGTGGISSIESNCRPC